MSLYLHLDHAISDKEVRDARALLTQHGFEESSDHDLRNAEHFWKEEMVYIGVYHDPKRIQYNLPVTEERTAILPIPAAQIILDELVHIFNPASLGFTQVPGSSPLSEEYEKAGYKLPDLPIK